MTSATHFRLPREREEPNTGKVNAPINIALRDSRLLLKGAMSDASGRRLVESRERRVMALSSGVTFGCGAAAGGYLHLFVASLLWFSVVGEFRMRCVVVKTGRRD